MVSHTYAKGRKAELERIAMLQKEGYICISAPKGNRFSPQKDLFCGNSAGVGWDICAYKPLYIGPDKPIEQGHWLLEQVKSNTTGGVLKKLTKVAQEELPVNTKARLVIRIDNKRTEAERWKIIELV